jgi:hypothetical protein
VTPRTWIAGALLCAFLAGVGVGQRISASISCRASLGLISGQGSLLAITHGSGIYQTDLLRAAEESRYADGADDRNLPGLDKSAAILPALIADRAAEASARCAAIRGSMEHEYGVISGQIGSRQNWLLALRRNRISPRSLRVQLALNLRTQNWIEQEIADSIQVSEKECRQYYENHLSAYLVPARFHAIHLFLAAPPETPSEIVEKKNSATDNLRTRIDHGEDFSELIMLASEDEATKTRGGDLGFFSDRRMPSDFLSAIKDMKIGETRKVRSRLGFHIVRLTEARASSQQTYAESCSDIHQMLANEKRTVAVAGLAARLSGEGEILSRIGQ